jgi:hypothetical protein
MASPNLAAALIPLTRGANAMIDVADLSLVEQHKWYLDTRGYARTRIASAKNPSRRSTLLMHRLIMNANDPGEYVDHANGNPLDNRRCNLRRCTNSQNQMNSKKAEGRMSQFKGVTLHRGVGKWQAQVKANGRNHYLGLFGTQEEAARAYNAKASKLFGEFARLNEVN